MTKNCLLFAVFWVVLGGVSEPLAIEILYPELHVSGVHPRVSLIGRTEGESIAIELNGKLVRTVQVQDSIFHVRVSIPYGLNDIRVRVPGEKGSQEEPVDLQVLCGPRIPKSYEKVFSTSEFHGPNSWEDCLPCHDSEKSRTGEGDASQWCYDCHSNIRQQFEAHGVGEDDICTNCHRISANLSRKTLGVYSDMNPCYRCHDDKIGEFAQDFIHGPVAGGTCTVCHSPHGSQFEYNLKSPLPVLCLFCHTSVGGMDERVIHEPVAEGHCTDCHDPHATGNRWVLVKKTGELCLGCHEEDIKPGVHRHPIGGEKPKSELVGGLDLDEKGLLECLTCHKPHGSQADYLLRSSQSNGCRECHPEY